MRKYVSRFPKERAGEALIHWEERELMKKAKKLGVDTKPLKKKAPAVSKCFQGLNFHAVQVEAIPGRDHGEGW